MTKPRTATGIAGMVSAARYGKRWTLRETARRSGLSIAFLCDVELGRRLPSAGTVLSLGRVLGLDADAMMRAIGEQKLAEVRSRIVRRARP